MKKILTYLLVLLYSVSSATKKNSVEWKELIKENKTSLTLDDFWKGQEKYGLSGSIVVFIDKIYGRE